ncbi:MAG: TA system VapC family ribonuclease toxin [Rhodomicrobium sp.]
MNLRKQYLLDINVLIALTDDEHTHSRMAHRWFASLRGDQWVICPLTEAGYIRFVANPATGFPEGSVKRAVDVLARLANVAGYCFWPMTDSWALLTAPFAARIFGHQQVTDAYLLGLAIKENGILVTFDHGIKYLAGPDFCQNLLILE